jgi:hypothetical protein
LKIDELDHDERLVLGALVRLVIAADQHFSPEEQFMLAQLGLRHGSPHILVDAISASATTLIGVESIREAAMRITRRPARILIVSIMDELAACDGITTGEHALLARIRTFWADTPEAGPFR